MQEHQHQTAERLKRAIAIDVVLAWRIQLMALLGREVPELPCDVFFENWEVTWKLFQNNGRKPKTNIRCGWLRPLRWSPNSEGTWPGAAILLQEQNVFGRE